MHTHRADTAPRKIVDHYATLDIPRDADTDAIRQAYIRLAKKYHTGANGGNEAKFIKAKDAYDILRNPLDRAAHDRTLPPQEESGSASSSSKTGTASGSGESASGTGETTSGTGSASGSTSSSASGHAGVTAPHPKTEPKRPGHHGHRHHGERNYPYTPNPVRPGYRYNMLRAHHMRGLSPA